MTSSIIGRLITFFTGLILLAVLLALPSYAHEVRPSYLELVQESSDIYRVLWKVPAKGNDLRLSLNVRFNDEVKSISKPREGFSGGSYTKRWRIQKTGDLFDQRIDIDGLESTFTEVLVRIEHLDGSVQVSRLMPDRPFVIIEESPSVRQVAWTYTCLGIKHILQGVDHLLFLVCLLIIARTPKRILITVTGFTLAHSITLALSSLNIVTLKLAPVEAIIALSIVFLATEIAKGKRETLTWRYPVTVSASFGLLHGFGFAAVLNEIGLPQVEMVTGLLFFNVGVEIGQLLFVIAIILITKFLVNMLPHINLVLLQRPMAYCVGSLATYWLLERSAFFIQ